MKDIETEKAMARSWIGVTPETEWPHSFVDHTRVLGILYLDYLERKEKEEGEEMTIPSKLSEAESEKYVEELYGLAVNYHDSITRGQVVVALRSLANAVEKGKLV